MSASSESSFIMPSQQLIDSDVDDDDLDSLPSETTEDSSHYSDAEREWRESLQQIELLLTMILIPYVGKYFGRKCAYWGWAKYMEWQYPVEIKVTSPGMFRAAGMVEAAATL
ncbi:hypothetical protein EJ05DRAFT_475829 [Pseudovirgaria hyperparasitica]|uniref:Uncharacterized protein n=1 Tax=Pseudovirgaria hyperparasitica TaxID=470096 RepID=A0A6A6W6L3_9PEZI|nr:uncharacterized protein EJ05DRAFT_475829 [Pseudovirgaria hyperparasitica]KAF2758528.1 hypothetical protein EJ05DRAFT_475829 [Pseudovirgaria hyperparasitica]